MPPPSLGAGSRELIPSDCISGFLFGTIHANPSKLSCPAKCSVSAVVRPLEGGPRGNQRLVLASFRPNLGSNVRQCFGEPEAAECFWFRFTDRDSLEPPRGKPVSVSEPAYSNVSHHPEAHMYQMKEACRGCSRASMALWVLDAYQAPDNVSSAAPFLS